MNMYKNINSTLITNIRMYSVYTNTGSYRCQDLVVSNCESCILLRLMFFSFELFITFKFVYKTSLMRKKTHMKCGKQWIILQDNSKNDVGKCMCDMRSENRIFSLDQNSVKSSNMERFTHVRFTYILCVRFNCLLISLYKLTTMHIPKMAFALKHIIQSWIERKIKWLNVFEN